MSDLHVSISQDIIHLYEKGLEAEDIYDWYGERIPVQDIRDAILKYEMAGDEELEDYYEMGGSFWWVSFLGSAKGAMSPSKPPTG